MYKIINGIETPLSEVEIREFNERTVAHTALIEELAPKEYQKRRENEFNKQGVTISNMVVALWERVIEDRPDSSDALQAIREQIKQLFPKPS